MLSSRYSLSYVKFFFCCCVHHLYSKYINIVISHSCIGSLFWLLKFQSLVTTREIEPTLPCLPFTQVSVCACSLAFSACTSFNFCSASSNRTDFFDLSWWSCCVRSFFSSISVDLTSIAVSWSFHVILSQRFNRIWRWREFFFDNVRPIRHNFAVIIDRRRSLIIGLKWEVSLIAFVRTRSTKICDGDLWVTSGEYTGTGASSF